MKKRMAVVLGLVVIIFGACLALKPKCAKVNQTGVPTSVLMHKLADEIRADEKSQYEFIVEDN